MCNDNSLHYLALDGVCRRTVGFGGWSDFKFLLPGRNVAGEDRIYAVDKFVQSQNNFEIEGNLQGSQVILERGEAQVDVTTAA